MGISLLSVWVGERGFWLVFLLLTIAWHYFMEPARWYVYLGRPGRIALPRLVQIFSLAALMSYLLPLKMGMPFRFLLLRRFLGLRFARASTSLLLDGLIWYAVWAMTSVAAFPFLYNGWWPGWRWVLASLTLAAVVAGLCRLPWYRAQWARATAFVCRWRRLEEGWREAMAAALKMRAGLVIVVALVLLDIVVYVARHWVLLRLVGHAVPLSPLFAVTVISVTAGLFSLMPMGLGGYDLTLVFLLAGQGIPVEAAAMVAMGNRMGNLAMSGLLGGWGGMVLGLDVFNRARMQKWLVEAQEENSKASSC